jgi:outer membrane protein TolC
MKLIRLGALAVVLTWTPSIAVAQNPTDPQATWRLSLDEAVKAGADRHVAATDVRSAYRDLAFATDAAAIAAQALALSSRLVDNYTARLNQGITPAALASAKAEQASRTEALTRAETVRSASEAILRRLISTEPNSRLPRSSSKSEGGTIEPTDRPDFHPQTLDIDRAIEHASQLLARDAERAHALQVVGDVTRSAIGVSNSTQSVLAAQRTRVLAERQLEAEQAALNAGDSTTYRVIQAQRDLSSAKEVELQAMLNYRKALVEFDRVQVAPPNQTR